MPCFNFGSCLVYNKAQEDIAKTDRLGFDVYNGIADVKSLWLKYCKQFEPRLRLLVPNFRVVSTQGEACYAARPASQSKHPWAGSGGLQVTTVD